MMSEDNNDGVVVMEDYTHTPSHFPTYKYYATEIRRVLLNSDACSGFTFERVKAIAEKIEDYGRQAADGVSELETLPSFRLDGLADSEDEPQGTRRDGLEERSTEEHPHSGEASETELVLRTRLQLHMMRLWMRAMYSTLDAQNIGSFPSKEAARIMQKLSALIEQTDLKVAGKNSQPFHKLGRFEVVPVERNGETSVNDGASNTPSISDNARHTEPSPTPPVLQESDPCSTSPPSPISDDISLSSDTRSASTASSASGRPKILRRQTPRRPSTRINPSSERTTDEASTSKSPLKRTTRKSTAGKHEGPLPELTKPGFPDAPPKTRKARALLATVEKPPVRTTRARTRSVVTLSSSADLSEEPLSASFPAELSASPEKNDPPRKRLRGKSVAALTPKTPKKNDGGRNARVGSRTRGKSTAALPAEPDSSKKIATKGTARPRAESAVVAGKLGRKEEEPQEPLQCFKEGKMKFISPKQQREAAKLEINGEVPSTELGKRKRNPHPVHDGREDKEHEAVVGSRKSLRTASLENP